MGDALELDLLDKVRLLVDSGASERAEWIRANLRTAMVSSGRDPVGISALSGISPGTVRGFLAGTDSSLRNVLRMAIALGLTLVDLERPPRDFAALLASRRDKGG